MISNIKRSTQIFAIAPLLLLVIGKILFMLRDSASESFYWLAYVAEFIFLWHLIFENKKADWLYSIVIGLLILGSIGDLFMIMHWPFTSQLLAAGALAAIIMACLFLYSAIKKSKHIQFEQLLLSLCLLAQLGLDIYSLVFNLAFGLMYAAYVYYPIAALCGTILLKNKYVNLGERNLILYLLVHSLFVVINQTFRLLT